MKLSHPQVIMRGQFWRLQKNIQCVPENNIFFSQNDVSRKENLELKPIYMLPFLFAEDSKMT